MDKVISIQKFKEEKRKPKSSNLTELMKHARLICKEKFSFLEEGLSIVKEGQLKSVFESRISNEIFSKKFISRGFFLCAIYISSLLEELVFKAPESFWAIDYADSDDPSVLKKGGDACFIICGVFPGRGNYRLMNIEYYRKIGSGFYYQFYSASNKEIGYHMSQNFEPMAMLVQRCFKRF